MLWGCPFVQCFWADILKWIHDTCEHCVNFEFSEILVIMGVKEKCMTDSVMDLLILLAKFHIYKSKLQNTIPNKTAFMNILKMRYNIDRFRHITAGDVRAFDDGWLPYRCLVE